MSYQVFSGEVSQSIVISDHDEMHVYSGGTAVSTTVNSNGCLWVFSGGVANSITVNGGGWLDVFSGGTALNVAWTPCVGEVIVNEGAMVTFASSYYGVYFGSDNALLSSGAAMTGLTLSGHSMYVMNGGAANETIINDWGFMEILNGGVANSTTVNGGGVTASSGGVVNSTTVNGGCVMYIDGGEMNETAMNDWSIMYISNGGVASKTAVNGSGSMYISNGGVASKTTVNDCGSMYVDHGGAARSTTVNDEGYLYVARGGTAEAIKENGGYVLVAEGASATFAANSFSGLVLESRSATVHSGTTANATTVKSEGFLCVEGGVANYTSVANGGGLYVSNGGTANSTTVNSCGFLYVDSGGVANFTTVNNGYLEIWDGGTANHITVNDGELNIEDNAVALNIDWDPSHGGHVHGDGTATFTTTGCFLSSGGGWTSAKIISGRTLSTHRDGDYYSNDRIAVFSGGTAAGNTVTGGHIDVYNGGLASGGVISGADGGWVNVYYGGSARSFNVGSGGEFEVYAGGTATDIKVQKGAELEINVAPETYFQGTFAGSAINIRNGVASGFTVVEDFEVKICSGGVASRLTVAAEGYLKISSGAKCDNITVNKDGELKIRRGATVTNLNAAAGADLSLRIDGNTNIQGKSAGNALNVKNGYLSKFLLDNDNSLDVYYGAVVEDLTMTGGDLWVDAGGKLTGKLNFSFSADYESPQYGWVEFSSGAIIDFDVSKVSAGAPALVKGLSLVIDNDEYYYDGYAARIDFTVTVSNSQRSGKYLLADRLDSFDDTLTVFTKKGDELGTLSVGGGFEHDDISYSLDLADGNLALTVVNSRQGGDPDISVQPETPIDGEIGYDGIYQNELPLELEHAGWYMVAGDFGVLNGSVSIVQGKKSVASGAIKNGVLTFNNGKNVLLDSANDYTIVVKNTDKGKSASEYSLTLEAKTLFTDGDDGWNNYLYDAKTKQVNAALVASEAVVIGGKTGQLDIDEDGANFVGFGDDTDFRKIELESAANLSFTVTATDAAKFTINRLIVSKDRTGNDVYTVKTLQTIALAKTKGSENFAATTKKQLLEAGTYYLSVQSTDAAKGGAAWYDVALAGDSVFFTDGDDGWNNYLYDAKTKQVNAALVASEAAVVDGETGQLDLDEDGMNFVGFGDDTDFRKIELESAANLSFTVTATDAAKFTINRLIVSKDRNGNDVYTVKALQTTALAKAKGNENFTATTKNQLLEAGTYYLSMQSTNATKGGAAWYDVALAGDSVFFTDGDDGRNNYLYDAKTKALNPEAENFVTTAISADSAELQFDAAAPEREGWSNFVGYGDAADFTMFTLDTAASLCFDVQATDAAKFTVHKLESKTDKQGNVTYGVKDLSSTSVKAGATATTKAVKLEAGTYYVSMQSTNAAKGGAAYYNVSVNLSKSDFFENLFVNYDAELSAAQQKGNTNVVLNWAASPADAKRKVTYFVTLDGGKEIKVTTTTYTFKNLTMDDHVFSVYAKDEYGNVSDVYDCPFTVGDTTDPKVANLTVTVKDKTATVKFKGTDNVGVAGYRVTLDGDEQYLAAADYNASTGLVLNGLAFGAHTVTVQAEDSSGNSSTVLTKNFTLNPPKGTMALDTSAAIPLDDNTYWVDAETTRIYRMTNDVAAFLKIYLKADGSGKRKSTLALYREVDDGLVVKVGSMQFDSKSSKPSYKIATESAGTYYIVLDAGSDMIEWDISPCFADPTNDSFDTATVIEDNELGYNSWSYKNFYMGATDKVDYYRFTVVEGGNYEYGAGYVRNGSIKQTLYDADRNKIVSKTITHDSDVRYLAAGDYYLNCEYSGTAATDYTLALWWKTV